MVSVLLIDHVRHGDGITLPVVQGNPKVRRIEKSPEDTANGREESVEIHSQVHRLRDLVQDRLDLLQTYPRGDVAQADEQPRLVINVHDSTPQFNRHDRPVFTLICCLDDILVYGCRVDLLWEEPG